MLDDFMFRAFLAGAGLAVAAGPLGCFVVWRRMAYFGDATAHAALLGVALSLAMSLPIVVGVLLISIIMAFAITALSGRRYALDTMLGVAAHVLLAVGLVAVSKMNGVSLDLSAYLFGDILAVTRTDIAIIWFGVACIVAVLIWRWNALLISTLNSDLAVARGVDVKREQLILMLTLAVLVAVAIKLVGALLITAILIVPAAAARPYTSSPERMAMLAIALAVLSVAGGLGMSLLADTPSGPSIVVITGVLFLLTNLLSARRQM